VCVRLKILESTEDQFSEKEKYLFMILEGAMTFSIMAHNIMTLSITALSIAMFRIMSFNIT
jgi:hypothetical protein